MDELISKSEVLELFHQLEISSNQAETIPIIKHRIEQMTGYGTRSFKVDTPKGQLVVTASKPTDNPNDYPGVFISLGKNLNGLLVCTEYNSAKDCLQTCVYQKDQEEPVDIIEHQIERM